MTGAAAAARALHGDGKGRAGAQIFRDPVEDHANRKAVVAQHLDPLADLHDHAAIGGKDAGALAGLLAVGGVGADDGDGLAHRLLHQGLGGEQVEVEILLDDADVRTGQGDRLGANLRGDVREFQARAVGGDVELPPVLHERKIVVVDGDRDLALGRLRRRRDFGRDLREGRQRNGRRDEEGGDEQQSTHEASPS